MKTPDTCFIDNVNLSGPATPWSEPVNGLRHLYEVAHWNQSIYSAVNAVLKQGNLPMVAGGDHSVAIGSISAVAAYCRTANKKLRVLWFDAHADSNSSATSPTGNIQGMPVACLLGHGPAALVSYAGTLPAICVDEIRFIGIRAVDTEEQLFVNEMEMQVLDMEFIRQHGIRNTIASALAGIDERTHLHVSFDLDCLDPTIAPGVGTAESGGLSEEDAMICAGEIAKTGLLGSVDIVELNPVFDTAGQTARLAVQIISCMTQVLTTPAGQDLSSY